MFTRNELSEIISTLKEAYLRAAASGGVSSYSLNSGQGATVVKQATMKEIQEQISHFQGLLNELEEIETGSNMTYIRGMGL